MCREKKCSFSTVESRSFTSICMGVDVQVVLLRALDLKFILPMWEFSFKKGERGWWEEKIATHLDVPFPQSSVKDILDPSTVLHLYCHDPVLNRYHLSPRYCTVSQQLSTQSVGHRPIPSVSLGSLTEKQDLRPPHQKLHFSKISRLPIRTWILKSNVPSCSIRFHFCPLPIHSLQLQGLLSFAF